MEVFGQWVIFWEITYKILKQSKFEEYKKKMIATSLIKIDISRFKGMCRVD